MNTRPPILPSTERNPQRDRPIVALIASLVFIGGIALLLAVSDFTHGLDEWSIRTAARLIDPVLLGLVVIHLALAGVMIMKGPANGLERALIRFMLAKAVLWAFVWRSEQPLGPEQLLTLLLVIGLTALDVFARLFVVYLWPVVRVFLPDAVFVRLEWVNARVRRLAFWRGWSWGWRPRNPVRRLASWRRVKKG